MLTQAVQEEISTRTLPYSTMTIWFARKWWKRCCRNYDSLRHTSKVVEIDYVDITHSISAGLWNNKESSQSSTREKGYGLKAAPNEATFTINVDDFLDIVNETHKSILSEDILKLFEKTRPENGVFAKEESRAKFRHTSDSRPRTQRSTGWRSPGNIVFIIEGKIKKPSSNWERLFVLALTYLPSPSPDKYFRHWWA